MQQVDGVVTLVERDLADTELSAGLGSSMRMGFSSEDRGDIQTDAAGRIATAIVTSGIVALVTRRMPATPVPRLRRNRYARSPVSRTSRA
jgi:hypothetical protein